MTPAPEMLDLVLSELQHVLRENLEQPWDAKHGQPPRYGYVEQTELTEDEGKKGKTIAAWHISPDAVRATPIKNLENPKIDGMFFDQFRAWFCFTHDFTAVFINWQIGPRFGRGFKHRIGRDTLGHYLLDKGVSTWVS
jgi:hypothetical protein